MQNKRSHGLLHCGSKELSMLGNVSNVVILKGGKESHYMRLWRWDLNYNVDCRLLEMLKPWDVHQDVGDAGTRQCLPRKATGLHRSWVKKETVCATGGRARRMGLTQALQSQDDTITDLPCQTWNREIWVLAVQGLITKWLPYTSDETWTLGC